VSEQPLHQAGCRDVIGPNLSLLFVGFNPGVASGETGYHFAGRNNRFWDLLFDVGLTESRLTFAEDRRLLPLGYGITNIVARPTPGSGDLATAELRAGAVSLAQKLAEWQPRIACYLGKGIYAALRRVPSAQITYGLQPASTVAGTLDFVAPSPSGRATIPYATKRAVMSELAALVRADEITVESAAQAAFAAALQEDSGFRAGDDLPAIPPASLYRLYGVARPQRAAARDALLAALGSLDGPVSVTTPSGTRLAFTAAGRWTVGCPGDGGAPGCRIAGDLGQVGLAIAPGTAEGVIVADAALGAVAAIGVQRGRLVHRGQPPLTGLLIGTHKGARFSGSPTECAAVRGAGCLVLGDPVPPRAQDGAPASPPSVEQGQLVLIEPTIVVGGRAVVTEGRLTIALEA